MAITKTDFINYTRCPRYCSLEELKKDRFDADITYQEYKQKEEQSELEELLSSMIEVTEDGVEIDKTNIIDNKRINNY